MDNELSEQIRRRIAELAAVVEGVEHGAGAGALPHWRG